jgi:hypothetical protein
MAVDARRAAASWAAGRDAFIAKAWKLLGWKHGEDDEPRRTAALVNLYDKTNRPASEITSDGDLAVNGGAQRHADTGPRWFDWVERVFPGILAFFAMAYLGASILFAFRPVEAWFAILTLSVPASVVVLVIGLVRLARSIARGDN